MTVNYLTFGGSFLTPEMYDAASLYNRFQIKEHGEEAWRNKRYLQHLCLERDGDVLGKYYRWYTTEVLCKNPKRSVLDSVLD